MNAKKELLDFLSGISSEMKCAHVIDNNNCEYEKHVLRVGYTQADKEKFLQGLDFQYHNGFILQEVDGVIWFTDGTWATRGMYDGAEWWEHHSCPEIPKELI